MSRISAILINIFLSPLISGIAQESSLDFQVPGEDITKSIQGLPDPFLKANGERIKTVEEWPVQRDYIKSMLAHFQYGQMPPTPDPIRVEEISSHEVYEGRGVQKNYLLTIERHGHSLSLRFGLIKPMGDGPFPIIIQNDRKVGNIPKVTSLDALERGYIMCQFVRTDLGTDIPGELEENRNNGVFLLYPEYSWGTIAAWAWGYSLIIDYLETMEFVDTNKIVATGHSRGGKTAFCAGIYDDRIAITAPNSSGLGGTASHRFFELGEDEQTIGIHRFHRPYWWTGNYFKLAGNEAMTPFDSHFGKAAIAPRALFNAHAMQDYHANPFGTHITHEAAKIVFKWLGVEDHIAMHWRMGGHAQGVDDWRALLDFSDQYFFDKRVESKFDINPYPYLNLPIRWDAPSEGF